MQGFELYPQAWALYVTLGIILLFLLDLKLRKYNFNIRLIFLSLIAVGAFTPQTLTETNSLAPLVLTSVLNAEVQGVKAIYKGLVTLLIIWGLVTASGMAIKHFLTARKRGNNESKQTNT